MMLMMLVKMMKDIDNHDVDDEEGYEQAIC